MRHILMVTQKFPPFSGVGVIRVSKFARYLQDFGWRPIILTCKRSSENSDALDAAMLKELPADLDVHRVSCPSLYDVYRLVGGRARQGSFALSESRAYAWVRALFVPDPYVGWYFTAVSAAKKIFQANRVDCIYTTSPRETPHLIGRTLRKRYGCPWVADFRDPWIEKTHRPRRVSILDRLERTLEKKTLMAADRILVAWPGIAEGFERVVPGVCKKIEVLTNGFDEQDFEGIQPQVFDRFTILYAGAFFKDLAPEPIFLALKMLYEAHPELRQKLQFVLLGRQDGYVRHLIHIHQLENQVTCIGQVPHQTCLTYMSGADVLLFSIPNKQWIPSKVFEYLRAGRPILALADAEADAVHFIRSIPSAACLASRSPKTISNFIRHLFDHRPLRHRAEEVPAQCRQFDRKHLTGQLAGILNETVTQNWHCPGLGQ